MRGAELTLEKVKQSPKTAPVRVHRLSDFVSSEELAELHKRNMETKASRKRFDVVDSYVAKIMRYFGYEAYRDWKMGIIPDYRMRRLVEAARALDYEMLAAFGGIQTLTGAADASHKKAKGPLQAALKIVQQSEKIAKGDN